MRISEPLTEEQKNFIDDNWETLSREEMAIELKLKSVFKITTYMIDNGYSKKVILTDQQKEFIMNNYKKMKEKHIAKRIGITRFFVQKFKRENNLFTYKRAIEKRKVECGMFNVNQRECWLV